MTVLIGSRALLSRAAMAVPAVYDLGNYVVASTAVAAPKGARSEVRMS